MEHEHDFDHHFSHHMKELDHHDHDFDHHTGSGYQGSHMIHHVLHEVTHPNGVKQTIVDNGVICFPKNSKAAQKLIASGVHGETVDQAEFEEQCGGWMTKIRHCGSQAEYTTAVHQYEEYVHQYQATHPGCSFPSVPSFGGASHVEYVHEPHHVVVEEQPAQHVQYVHEQPAEHVQYVHEQPAQHVQYVHEQPAQHVQYVHEHPAQHVQYVQGEPTEHVQYVHEPTVVTGSPSGCSAN